MQLEIGKIFTFESSHILSKHPGRCSRLHGHSWNLSVYVKAEINPDTGFAMDYADLKAAVQPIIDDLDHKHLGQWAAMDAVHGLTWEIFHESTVKEGENPHPWKVSFLPLQFYPSSENLIVAIGTALLGTYKPLDWSKLELNETCTSKCILTREEYETIKGRNSTSRKE
jgi:queuosine biosynthesis protein QueD